MIDADASTFVAVADLCSLSICKSSERERECVRARQKQATLVLPYTCTRFSSTLGFLTNPLCLATLLLYCYTSSLTNLYKHPLFLI